MSNEIQWPDPDKLFNIVSKVGNLNYALMADTSTGVWGVKLRPTDGSIEQLWRAQKDDRGGAYLQLAGTDLYLDGNRSTRVLTVQPRKLIGTDQLWRVEDLGSPWTGINSTGDWELKINVYGSDLNGRIGLYGWDGGHDNEKWLIRKEAGKVTVDSIEYDLTLAHSDVVPPSHCAAADYDNTGGSTTVTNTYELERSVTKQRIFIHSESTTNLQRYTETLGVSGGIGKFVEVSASASFEQTHSTTIAWSDEMSDSVTLTDKITTQLVVPPGKRYSCYVIVHYGKVTVPYTAHLTFQSSTPGIPPVRFIRKGTFTGVNSTTYEIVTKDVTSPQADQQHEVQRRPVSKSLAA